MSRGFSCTQQEHQGKVYVLHPLREESLDFTCITFSNTEQLHKEDIISIQQIKKLRFVHLSNGKCKEDETHGEKSNEHGQVGVKQPISFPFFFACRVTIPCLFREGQGKEYGLKQHPFHPRLGFSGSHRDSPGRLLSYPQQDAILAGEALAIRALLPLSSLPIVLCTVTSQLHQWLVF